MKKRLEGILVDKEIPKSSEFLIYFIRMAGNDYGINIESKISRKTFSVKSYLNEKEALPLAEELYDFLKNKGYDCSIDMRNLPH